MKTNSAAIAVDMGRPKTDTTQITLRVPTSWLEQADEEAKHLGNAFLPMQRTDVFRAAIAFAFARWGAERGDEWARMSIGEKIRGVDAKIKAVESVKKRKTAKPAR